MFPVCSDYYLPKFSKEGQPLKQQQGSLMRVFSEGYPVRSGPTGVAQIAQFNTSYDGKVLYSWHKVDPHNIRWFYCYKF